MEVSFTAISPFLEFLEIRGLATKNLLKSAGITDSQPERISMDQHDKLWIAALQELNDPRLGLHYGAYLKLTALGIVYQLSKACETTKQAIPYLGDTISALIPSIVMTEGEDVDDHLIQLRPRVNWVARNSTVAHNVMCAVMLLVYREILVMTGVENSYVKMAFPHSGEEALELREIFHTSVEFSDSYQVIFPKFVLSTNLQATGGSRLELLVMEFQKYILENRHSAMNQKDIISLIVLNTLGDGVMPSVESVAYCLNQSRRTFQRRLQEEGLMFREILDGLLRTLGKRLTDHNSLSVNDISHALGYAEASSFIHAYERWFNTTPRRKG